MTHAPIGFRGSSGENWCENVWGARQVEAAAKAAGCGVTLRRRLLAEWDTALAAAEGTRAAAALPIATAIWSHAVRA
jgi:hypothetical protein